MSIQRIASGKWRVQIRRRSVRFDEVFATELEARQAEAQQLRRVNPKASSIDVNNAWKLYEASLEFAAKRERTRRTESGRIKRWLKRFGDLPIASITSDDVEEFIAARLRQKPAPGADTVRLEVAAFSALLKYCVRKKFLASNPCIGVSRPSGARKLQRMSKDDIAQLMTLLRHPNRRFRYAARLCLLVLATGARPGEWSAVKKRDVDLAKGVVTFQETKYRGQPRSVPLTPVATKLLADHLAELVRDPEIREIAHVSEILFPVIGKDDEVHPLHYTGALRDAKKKGLVPRSVRAHLGRHEFISTLVESSKLDDSRIMALVGHHSPASMEIYKHVRNVQFRPDIEDIETRVMRPQRAEALAESLDLPVSMVNLVLESQRIQAAKEGFDDPGDELLYQAGVLGNLKEMAAGLQAAPALRTMFIEMARREREARRRERADAGPVSPITEVTTVLEQAQPSLFGPSVSNRASHDSPQAPSAVQGSSTKRLRVARPRGYRRDPAT